MSPALSYTSKHLHSDVEKEKKEKLPKEFEEDKIKREEEKRGIPANFLIHKCHFFHVRSQHILWCCFPETAVNSQKLRRERTQLEDHGSRTCSAHTARTAASKTACTTWEIMCMWSLQSQTFSLISSTLNAFGKMTLVSLMIAFTRL